MSQSSHICVGSFTYQDSKLGHSAKIFPNFFNKGEFELANSKQDSLYLGMAKLIHSLKCLEAKSKILWASPINSVEHPQEVNRPLGHVLV